MKHPMPTILYNVQCTLYSMANKNVSAEWTRIGVSTGKQNIHFKKISVIKFFSLYMYHKTNDF